LENWAYGERRAYQKNCSKEKKMAELVSATAADTASASSSSSGAPGVAAVAKRNPSDFLRQVLGKPVLVELNSGVSYRGILACLDGFMNIAMEQTEEYVNGQLKARYGDCFIRGNNGKTFKIIRTTKKTH